MGGTGSHHTTWARLALRRDYRRSCALPSARCRIRTSQPAPTPHLPGTSAHDTHTYAHAHAHGRPHAHACTKMDLAAAGTSMRRTASAGTRWTSPCRSVWHSIACWVLHAILYRQRWNALDIVMLCMRSRIAALRSSARSSSAGRASCMFVCLHDACLRIVCCASSVASECASAESVRLPAARFAGGACGTGSALRVLLWACACARVCGRGAGDVKERALPRSAQQNARSPRLCTHLIHAATVTLHQVCAPPVEAAREQSRPCSTTPQSRRRCGSSEPSPGADVEAGSPVPRAPVRRLMRRSIPPTPVCSPNFVGRIVLICRVRPAPDGIRR